jgi:TonB family protein
VYENEAEDPKPSGKPPYFFLIPVALGVVGFIGYQTVRMGTDTSVAVSPYAADTSLVQAAVTNGVITVHANRPSAPRSVKHVVRHVALNPKPKSAPSLAPKASDAPSAAASETPEPAASPTVSADSEVAQKPHPKAHRAKLREADDRIAVGTVPHIERPIAAHLVSNSQSATAPPDTDIPTVAHGAPAAQNAAPAPAPPTAKPVVVAQAPAPVQAQTQSGPVNAADRIVDARMSYAATPDYPDMARDQGIRGTSVVLVTVDPSGSIVHMSIASSSGNGALDRAALVAARSSQYIAPKVDGKPAIETYRVTYDFAP